jgi:hypothetical protein
MRRWMGVTALVAVLGCQPVGAQVSQLWAVNEADVVVSWAWPDLDGDGVQELLMEDGEGCWFFDGANAYEQVWSVVDANASTTTVFQLWDQQGGWCVFRQQDTTNQTARLHIYASGATQEAWSTTLLPGNITNGGIGDVDGDGQLELAYSWHNWDGSAYTSSWTVRNLATGAVELAPQSGAGYLAGPFVANIEGGEADEILLNWYWTSGTPQLICWGSGGTAVSPERPRHASLTAFPNPFNPACRIQFDAGPEIESVTIHNLAGQELRRLPVRMQGRVDLVWDGLDQRGRAVASGVYLVRAGSQSLQVTLVK